MRVAVAGASGFVGRELLPLLRSEGHEVQRLVRRPASAPDEVSWNPAAGSVDLDALSGVEAIVNLAGPGIGDKRWSESRKQTLYDGFVGSARVLAAAAAELHDSVSTLVSVGGMGYYGNDNPGGRLREDAPAGTDFTARISVDKENATEPASAAGVRVVLPRLSLVMDSSGSTMGRRLLPLAKLGLLGPLAGGGSTWSVVSVSDVARALLFMLEHESLAGPVNVSAPVPTTNKEFTRLLGERVNRPTILPVPKFGLKLVLGEFADDVLASFDIDPTKLIDAGFTFEHPDAAAVIAAAVPR
jgi:uncharacterized protein (TIGR01777 family)